MKQIQKKNVLKSAHGPTMVISCVLRAREIHGGAVGIFDFLFLKGCFFIDATQYCEPALTQAPHAMEVVLDAGAVGAAAACGGQPWRQHSRAENEKLLRRRGTPSPSASGERRVP